MKFKFEIYNFPLIMKSFKQEIKFVQKEKRRRRRSKKTKANENTFRTEYNCN